MCNYQLAALGIYGLGIIMTLIFLTWIEIVYNGKDNTVKENIGAATIIVAIALFWPLFWAIATAVIIVRGFRRSE